MPNRSVRDEMQAVAPTRTYGAPLGPQAHVNAPDRPKVGPAAPPVQKAALAQQGLYRKPLGSPASAAPASPPPRPASPPPTSNVGNPTSDLTAQTAVNRVASYPGQVDQAIDEQSK